MSLLDAVVIYDSRCVPMPTLPRDIVMWHDEAIYSSKSTHCKLDLVGTIGRPTDEIGRLNTPAQLKHDSSPVAHDGVVSYTVAKNNPVPENKFDIFIVGRYIIFRFQYAILCQNFL